MTITVATSSDQCSPTDTVTDQIQTKRCVHVGAYAVGTAVILGTAGGVAGFTGGAAAGAAAGTVGAVFTFGLSIPIGTVIGGGIGLCTGASAGTAAGAVGGIAFGLRRAGRSSTHLSKTGEQVAFHMACAENPDLHEALKMSDTSMLESISEEGEEHTEHEEHDQDVEDIGEQGRDGEEPREHEDEDDHEESEEDEGEHGLGDEWDGVSCGATNGSATVVTPRADDRKAATQQECRLSVLCSVTKVGDELGVVGGNAAFGDWDVSKALKLKTSAAEYPRWSTGFALPEATTDYKLFILHSDGGITWEPLKGNRILEANESGRFTISTCYGKLGHYIDRH